MEKHFTTAELDDTALEEQANSVPPVLPPPGDLASGDARRQCADGSWKQLDRLALNAAPTSAHY